MYTKSERVKLERVLRKLEKCGGDCKHCSNCHFYSAEGERAIYYAFGCDLLPQDMFSYISNSSSQLHNDAVECLRFELS